MRRSPCLARRHRVALVGMSHSRGTGSCAQSRELAQHSSHIGVLRFGCGIRPATQHYFVAAGKNGVASPRHADVGVSLDVTIGNHEWVAAVEIQEAQRALGKYLLRRQTPDGPALLDRARSKYGRLFASAKAGDDFAVREVVRILDEDDVVAALGRTASKLARLIPSQAHRGSPRSPHAWTEDELRNSWVPACPTTRSSTPCSTFSSNDRTPQRWKHCNGSPSPLVVRRIPLPTDRDRPLSHPCARRHGRSASHREPTSSSPSFKRRWISPRAGSHRVERRGCPGPRHESATHWSESVRRSTESRAKTLPTDSPLSSLRIPQTSANGRSRSSTRFDGRMPGWPTTTSGLGSPNSPDAFREPRSDRRSIHESGLSGTKRVPDSAVARPTTTRLRPLRQRNERRPQVLPTVRCARVKPRLRGLRRGPQLPASRELPLLASRSATDRCAGHWACTAGLIALIGARSPSLPV